MKNDSLTVSTSYHKLGHIYTNNKEFNYILLGTIFDQLTGKFNAGYNEHSLRAVIEKTKIPLVARGGTTIASIPICADLGFHGIAFGSTIWNSASPVQTWCSIVDTCRAQSIAVQ